MSTKVWLPALIVLFLLLLAGGFYWYQLRQFQQTGETQLSILFEPKVGEVSTLEQVSSDRFLRGVLVAAEPDGSIIVRYGTKENTLDQEYQYFSQGSVVCWPRTLNMGGQQVDALRTLFAVEPDKRLVYPEEEEFVYSQLFPDNIGKFIILDIDRAQEAVRIAKFVVIDCDL